MKALDVINITLDKWKIEPQATVDADVNALHAEMIKINTVLEQLKLPDLHIYQFFIVSIMTHIIACKFLHSVFCGLR